MFLHIRCYSGHKQETSQKEKKKMSLTSTFKKAKNAKRRDDWLDKMKQQKNLFENTESGRQGGGEGEEEQ